MSARAEYMRRWREENPDLERRNRELSRARNAAYSRMARRYPSLWAEVYDEVCQERGITFPNEYER